MQSSGSGGSTSSGSGRQPSSGGGRVFISPIEVRFSDNDVVQPDIVFVADRDLRIVTPDRIDGVPTGTPLI